MQITLDGLLDLLARCSLNFNRDRLQFIWLRGTRVLPGGELQPYCLVTDMFNDELFAVHADQGYLWHCKGTSGIPGWYWIRHGSYAGPKDGAPFARLCGDIKYTRGDHRGHKALVQVNGDAGRIPVIRDLNKDGSADFAELRRLDGQWDKVYPWATGIHLHASDGLTDHVQWASSGCMVVASAWDAEPWATINRLVYGNYSTQLIFPVSILDGRWYGDGHHRLLYGSVGGSVQAMQRRLKVTPSGVFDRFTDKALRDHQAAIGDVPSGILLDEVPAGVGTPEEVAKAQAAGAKVFVPAKDLQGDSDLNDLVAGHFLGDFGRVLQQGLSIADKLGLLGGVVDQVKDPTQRALLRTGLTVLANDVSLKTVLHSLAGSGPSTDQSQAATSG